MHYYQFNIGDYRKDTAHLTPMEHYIYRTLIDWYYLNEAPIPKETQVVIRRLSLDYAFEKNLLNVLQDFFVLDENGWKHKRIDLVIRDYHEQCVKNKLNGKLGGRPKKTQVVSERLAKPNPKEPNRNPNQEPITNNQEPINTSLPAVKKKARTQFPEIFIPTQAHLEFARNNKLDLEHEFVKFKLHHEEKVTLSGNWNSSFSKWLHNAVEFRKPNGSSRVQEARLDVIDQIMGGLHHETKRQTRDITPGRTIESNGARIPETPFSLRKPDAS